MDMRATQNKELRGIAMRALHINWPQRMGDNVLETLIIQAGGQATDVEPIIAYLEDKGYVEKQPANSTVGVPRHFLRLTAQGVDLLEGTTKDPGVTLP